MAYEFSGKDVTVTFLGKTINAREVQYGYKQDITKIRVMGKKFPVATAQKAFQGEGTLTMLSSEYTALRRSLGSVNPATIIKNATISWFKDAGVLAIPELYELLGCDVSGMDNSNLSAEGDFEEVKLTFMFTSENVT